MKRLITFGCSFTAGEGLPDKLGKQHLSDIKSRYAWPTLLGEITNQYTINKAEGGMSNKQIWHSVLSTEYQPSDQVIIQWTFAERHAILKKNKENLVFGSWSSDKTAKLYYKKIYDEYDAYLDYFVRQDHAKKYLDSLGIENYHVFNDRYIKTRPSWCTVKYLDIDMEKCRVDFPLAEDGYHPGLEAHEYYAQTILALIKKRQFRNLNIE